MEFISVDTVEYIGIFGICGDSVEYVGIQWNMWGFSGVCGDSVDYKG